MFSKAIAVNILKPVMATLSLDASETTVCPDATVIFAANTTGTVFNYKWTRNGVPVGTNASVYIGSNFSDGETVAVSVESAMDCETGIIIDDTVLMKVPGQTSANISITGDTLLMAGQAAVLNAIAINAGRNATYQWQVSKHDNIWRDINNANTSSLTYVPAITGVKIRCVLTYDTDCVAGKTAYSNALTMNFINTLTDARIYPNPVSTELNIGSPVDAGSVEISSAVGIRIYTKTLNGESKLTVNVAALPAGIYLVVIHRKNMDSIKLTFAKM